MLLEALKAFTEDAVKGLSYPEAVQKGDTEQKFRAPDVYKQRVPNGDAVKKYVPYVLIQFVTGQDKQEENYRSEQRAQIRFICTTYSKDEEEGSMMLLNLMDRIRIKLLEEVVVADTYKLDTDEGIDSAYYTDDTAPYYIGEMSCTFMLPAIRRKVDLT